MKSCCASTSQNTIFLVDSAIMRFAAPLPWMLLRGRPANAFSNRIEKFFQLFAVFHRVFCGLVDSPELFAKMRKPIRATITQRRDRLWRLSAPPLAHHRNEQRRPPIGRLAFERDLVILEFATPVRVTEHLLAPRIGDFGLCQLRCSLYFSGALHFHKFIDQVQKRSITRSGER